MRSALAAIGDRVTCGVRAVAPPRGIALVLAALLCWGAGCGPSGPELAPVTGTVTLDGAPLDEAGVMFVPENGPVATGNTDHEGRFRLTTGNRDGALLGNHTVTVNKSQFVGVTVEEGEVSGPAVSGGYREEWLIPKKYSRGETSGLRETVERGENHFQYELKSE